MMNNRFSPWPSFTQEEIDSVSNVLSSNKVNYWTGEECRKFEKEFAAWSDSKHAVAVANGTVAIDLALKALDVSEGDEVIVTSRTFLASVSSIVNSGARPVFADICINSQNVLSSEISKLINSKTKAILCVHLAGFPCEMDHIMKIAKEHNLFVIEDCAEATGATINGEKVGSIGDIGCFSFFGNKIITTGEGGMCTTNNSDLNERMRVLRDHGMDKSKRYWHNEIGYNYRMTNLSAAIGVAQMEQISFFLKKRQKLRIQYDNLINFNSNLLKPVDSFFGNEVEWFYNINLSSTTKIKRDELIFELSKVGIDSRPFFYPIHLMPPYLNYTGTKKDLINAETFGKNGMNLPLYPSLSIEDVKFISTQLNKILS